MSSVDVVKQLYEAFSRRDIEGVLQTLAPDVDCVEEYLDPTGLLSALGYQLRA